MAAVSTTVEANLTCSVCCQLFRSPRLLPCLHTFCHECIDAFASVQAVCPMCRADFVRGTTFPLNFIANDLVEALKLQNSISSNAVVCDHCDSVAKYRCLPCSEWMCDSHWDIHSKSKKTSQHATQSLHEYKELSSDPQAQNASKRALCSQHPDESLKLFCRTCARGICRDCTLIDHRSHEFVFLTDICKELTSKIRDCVEESQEHTTRVGKDRTAIRNVRSNIAACSSAAKQAIQDTFERVIQAARTRAEKLDADVAQYSKLALDVLDAQETALQVHAQHLQGARELAEHILAGRQDLILMAPQVLERMRKLTQAPWPVLPLSDFEIFFNPDDGLLQCIGTTGVVTIANQDAASLTLAVEPTEDLRFTIRVASTATPVAAQEKWTAQTRKRLLALLEVTVCDSTGAITPVHLEECNEAFETVTANIDRLPFTVSVLLLGAHVLNSPLQVLHARPPFSFKFSMASDGITISEHGTVATLSVSNGHHVLLATPALRSDGIEYWAIDVIATGHWIGLGILGELSVSKNNQSYCAPTSFMFANGNQEYQRGSSSPQTGSGWASGGFQFQVGDTALFCLNMSEQRLSLYVSRVGRVFTMAVPPGSYYIHCNLYNQHSQVRLRPLTVAERAFLPCG